MTGRCGMCGNTVDAALREQVESLLADLTEYANDKKHPERREVAAALICLRLKAALGSES